MQQPKRKYQIREAENARYINWGIIAIIIFCAGVLCHICSDYGFASDNTTNNRLNTLKTEQVEASAADNSSLPEDSSATAKLTVNATLNDAGLVQSSNSSDTYQMLTFDKSTLPSNSIWGKTEASCSCLDSFGFYCANRNSLSAFSSGGIPTTGRIDTTDGSITVPFTIAAGDSGYEFDGNDSIKLTGTSSSLPVATSNLTKTGAYKSLYVLAAGASVGTGTSGLPLTATVNYSDGTYSTTSITMYDWYDTVSVPMYAGLMRSSNGTSTNGSTSAGPYLDAIPLNVDSSKIATSITYTRTDSRNATIGIYAVSGVISGDVPSAPTANAASSMSTTGFTCNWSSVSGATSYVLDVSTSSSFTSGNIVSSQDVGNVTSYTVSTTTSSSTRYYYRVRAKNSYGQSASSNVVSPAFIQVLAGSSTVTYSGSQQSYKGLQATSFTLGDTTYTVSGAEPSTAATGTNAGTYYGSYATTSGVKVYVGSTQQTSNVCVFTNTSTKATLVINKATATIDMFSITRPTTKTYDGANLSAASVTTSKGFTSWSWCYVNTSTSATYSSSTTFKDVITLKIRITVNSDDKNYNSTTLNDTNTFGINQKTISYTASAYSAAYDGAAHSVTVTPSGKTCESTDFVVTYGTTKGTYSSTNPSYTDVTTTTVYFKITDPASSGNYKVVEDSRTVTISKRVLTIQSASGSWQYDGTSHSKADGVKLNNIVSGETYTAKITSPSTIKNVGTTNNTFSYSNISITWGTAKSTNYNVSDDSTKFVYGTLTVTAKPVTITANNASKTYGDADPSYTYTATGMVDGESATSLFNVGFTRGTGEDVGAYTLTPTGATSQNNYTLSFVSGQLEITKRPIKITTFSDSKDYDGTALVGTGETTGWADGEAPGSATSDATLEYTGTITNYGTAQSTYKLTWGTNVKESNYNLSSTQGTLSITKKSIQISTESATKVYDGTALTKNEGSIEGLVNTSDCTMNITGSQISVGVSDNTYDLVWASDTMKDNYQISSVKTGVLCVYEYADEIPIITKGETFIYDGKEHWATVETPTMPTGYTIVKKSDTYSGYTTAHGTDFTDGPVAATCDNLKIINAQNEDVTARLNIKKIDGALVINKAPLYVTTASATKVYDGTALESKSTYTFTGLVNSETAGFSVTGSQTSAGISANSYTIDWASTSSDYTAKSTNYCVNENLGKLTVNKRYLYIETGSANKNYSGSGTDTLTSSEINYTHESEGKGLITKEGTIRATGSISSSGTSTNGWNTYEFVWNTANDSTNAYSADNYDISTKLGQLVILASEAKVYVWLPGGTYTYDGTAHSATVQVFGPNTDGYDVSYTNATSATNVGTVKTEKPNDLKIYKKGTTEEITEYDVATDDIIINACPISVTTPSASKSYDGTALSASDVKLTGVPSADASKVTVSTTGTRVDAGNSLNTYKIEYKDDAVASNYTVTESVGTLKVEQIVASVATLSAQKVYDKTELTWTTPKIAGVIDGDLDCNVTGTQTAVGSSDNTYELTWTPITSNDNPQDEANDTATKESNYSLREATGTLTVKEYNNIITLSAETKEVTYDGKAHTCEVKTSDAPTGYEFVNLSCSTTQTNVGTSDVECDGYTINRIETDGTKTNVTNTLKTAGCISTPTGQITVNAAPLTVTTESNTKTYDGSALTAKSTKLEGLVNDEKATLTNIPSITHVADSGKTLTYSISWGTATSTNYEVKTESLGTLTIDQRPVSVEPEAKTKVYDTADPQLTANVMDGVETGKKLSEVIPADKDKVAYELSRVAGEDVIYKNGTEEYGGYEISADFAASQADYSVTSTTSLLVITPATIQYDKYDQTRDFDGYTTAPPSSLVAVRYPSDSYTKGYKVTYSTSYDGTYSEEAPEFRDAGTYKVYFKINAADFYQVGGDTEDTAVYFTLTINPISIASSNVIITLGDTHVYNGKNQEQTITSIKCGDYYLVEGADEDYQIDGTSNIGKDATSYTMTIKGSKNFNSSTTVDWSITSKPINVKWNGEDSFIYNAKHQSKTTEALDVCEGDTVNCVYDFETVEDNGDLSLLQTNNPRSTIDVGTYKGTISALDNSNYSLISDEACTCTYTITPLSIKNATVKLAEENVYNGKEQTQEVISVYVGDILVPFGTGCEVRDNTNISALNYTLGIYGFGNFMDSIGVSYDILQKPITLKWDGNYRFLQEDDVAQSPTCITQDLVEGDECEPVYSYYTKESFESEKPEKIDEPILHGKYVCEVSGLSSSDYTLADDAESYKDFIIAKSSSKTVVESGDTNVEVKGLEEAAATELEKHTDIDDYCLKLVFTKKDASNLSDIALIKNIGQKDNYDAFDLSLVQVMDGQESNLASTENVLQVKVPHIFILGQDYAAYRVHEGVASAMTEIPSVIADETKWQDNQAVLNTTDSLVTLYSQNFSTYAIGYNNIPEPAAATYDSNIYLVGALQAAALVTLLIACGVVVLKRRNSIV